MIDVLQTDPKEWEEISTDSINTHAQLCHLQSLYIKLQETMDGSPLQEIVEVYKEALSPPQIGELEILVKRLGEKERVHLGSIITVLRDFMMDQLTEAKWENEHSLKEYLGYTGAMSDEEDEWFENYFPDIFQLRHSFELYQWLSHHLK